MFELISALGSLSGENGTKKCYDPELGRCGEQLRVQVAGLVELDIEGMGIALLEA